MIQLTLNYFLRSTGGHIHAGFTLYHDAKQWQEQEATLGTPYEIVLASGAVFGE